MRYYFTFLLLFLFNNLLAQIALPTFHGIQKPDPPIPFVNYAIEFDGSGDKFTVNVDGTDTVEINTEGTVVYKPLSASPSPVDGGLFFSASGEFYVGT